jgi:N-ethylmaleimide reductase
LEVIDIALKHFEPYQIGIKLSPISLVHDMFDENPLETFSHLLKELSKRNIGFVELLETPSDNPNGDKPVPHGQIKGVCKTLRPYFNGLLIGNLGFNP